MDLKITNRGKDFFIEQLKSGYEDFAVERQGYVEKLMTFNRKVGELENRLLQLDRSKEPEPDARDFTQSENNISTRVTIPIRRIVNNFMKELHSKD